MTKVREQARFHSREKRGVQQEVTHTAERESVGEPIDGTQQPGEALALAEQFEHVLAELSEEERRIVDLKLKEHTNREIADLLGCSERTVRRLLAELRTRLEEGLVA